MIKMLYAQFALIVSVLIISACSVEEDASVSGQASSVMQTALPEPSSNGNDAETLRMVQRLELIHNNTDPFENSFLNEQRVEAQQREWAQNPQTGSEGDRFRMAVELLRAGFSEQAAELFKGIIAVVERSPDRFEASLLLRLKSYLGISLMRMGEQQNCVMMHGAKSCLFPLDQAAVHQNQEGSRQAMTVYLDLLEHNPDDLVSRWLLNLAALTIGQYPQAIPARWQIPLETFDSEDQMAGFTDNARLLGVDLMGLAGGVVLDDFNGDNHIDLMASSWGDLDQIRLFMNNGDGQFTETTHKAGLTGITGGLNLVQADYDNDGDVDVLVLRGAWLIRSGKIPNSLLRNDGNGRFSDVTESTGLLTYYPTQTAAWADYDRDGWLDLIIGNESRPNQAYPVELYHNAGNGTFVNQSAQAGLVLDGFVKAVVWGDINNDGWPDLYVSQMSGKNRLFKNNGNQAQAQFTNISETAGVESPLFSFPAWFWDFNQDGYEDIFVADFPPNAFIADTERSTSEGQINLMIADILGQSTSDYRPYLYQNQGDGRFIDVSETMGLTHPSLAMGANYGDLDNDGFPDFYIGNGAPDFRTLIPNKLYRNQHGESFADVTTAAGVGHLQKGHGIAIADIDHDGDQDIYAVMGGAYSGDGFYNALFVNSGNQHDWITLKLVGVKSNRSAIGAKIKLTVIDEQQQARDIYTTVSSGGSFGANSLQQEIGLGSIKSIKNLQIQWPSGLIEQFDDIQHNQLYRITEGESSPQMIETMAVEQYK